MGLTLANMISPLMISALTHLIIGNALLGMLEGSIIAKVFRASWWKAIGLLILANYLSTFIGLMLLGLGEQRGPFVAMLFDEPVNQLTQVIWISIAAITLLTVLIEWPFCFAALRDQKQAIRRSIMAVLLVHAVSYGLLVPYYLVNSHNTLNSEVAVVAIDALDLDSSVHVYFIDHAGDVQRINLNGTSRQHIFSFDAPILRPRTHRQPILFVDEASDAAQSEQHPTTVSLDQPELRAYLFRGRDDSPRIISLDGYAERPWTATRYTTDQRSGPASYFTIAFGSLAVTDLRLEDQPAWRLMPQFYQGLVLEHHENGEQYTVSFQTVLDTWVVRNVTVLPGDVAVFEFGGQICVLDIPARRLALLAMGYGPVAVLTE